VVSIREPEPQKETSGDVEAQGIDQLLTQQPHGGCTQKHDALLVQSDDALIGPEIKQLSDVKVSEIGRVRQRLACLHVGAC
jgi:hypothetical protein